MRRARTGGAANAPARHFAENGHTMSAADAKKRPYSAENGERKGADKRGPTLLRGKDAPSLVR